MRHRLVLLVSCIAISSTVEGQMDEGDRVEEYNKRNHVWPPTDEMYVPPTAGWRHLFKKRIRQLEGFEEDSRAKWNGYMMTVHQALLSPNFTENGWGLTRAPQHIIDALRMTLHSGLVSDPELEEDGEDYNFPLFVELDGLDDYVLEELKPMHEAWAGVELTGALAYGLRVYKNESTLDMHVDQSGTHVISSILHVDHDPVGDPWPIVIEDFQGNTNEVYLEAGDMLFYESSKCLHGRPSAFNGAWYSSLFVHYYPVDWDDDKVSKDIECRIPPGWEDAPVSDDDDDVEELVVVGTSMLEPGCEHSWCALKDSVKWSGPGEFGKVLSAGGVVTELDISMTEQSETDEL